MGFNFRAAVRPALVAVVLVTSAAAQSSRSLTLEAIYDPGQRVDWSGDAASEITWLDDNTYLTTRAVRRGREWIKVEAQSGRATDLFDADRMVKALRSLPGVSSDQARLRAGSG